MAGHGGARVGAGRKKGSTNLIRIQTLRDNFDASLGIPFEKMLANMMLKLYNDFQQDHNVDSATRFALNMARHMVQPVPQVVETEVTVSDLSHEDINNRLANLLTRKELTEPTAEE